MLANHDVVCLSVRVVTNIYNYANVIVGTHMQLCSDCSHSKVYRPFHQPASYYGSIGCEERVEEF